MRLHEYGTLKKIPFEITLNGEGVSVTFATGDIKIIKDGTSVSNIINTPVEVDSSGAKGHYYYLPTAAETQCSDYVTLYIKDVAGGGVNFDENKVTHYTGGNSGARFAG